MFESWLSTQVIGVLGYWICHDSPYMPMPGNGFTTDNIDVIGAA